MTREHPPTMLRWITLALGSCLCLGLSTLGPGCAPGASTNAAVNETPARLRAMQANGRASIAIKNSKRPLRTAPRPANPR
jgi:hypothetical protein